MKEEYDVKNTIAAVGVLALLLVLLVLMFLKVSG